MISAQLVVMVALIMTRSTPGQIRRAAGSKDSSVLKKAVEGWTAEELDAMASQDGKSALHMAAWQGCLENVQLLLELGANVNGIATVPYSYGKTPIFFAATRCRNEIVQYLLQNNASVKIVNNKGQSVLSIASSHLTEETIQAIQHAEKRENDEWINYRETHSDGLEYGDLDPRFLERPLRTTDVVTELAVNPTTKQSRRGSFTRRNPHLAKEITGRNVKTQQSCSRKLRPDPSLEEVARQEQVWQSMAYDIAHGGYDPVVKCMLCVVQLEERQKRSWMMEAAAKLQCILKQSDDGTVIDRLQGALEKFTEVNSGCTRREAALLKKWIQQTCAKSQDKACKAPSRIMRAPISLEIPPWSTASRGVRGLSHVLLLNRHESQLSLPERPHWVNTERGLLQLDGMLRKHARQAALCCVMALDTEWYTAKDGSIHASTRQISVASETLQTWIVDLLLANETQSAYSNLIRELLSWLFDEESNVVLLGFCFAHDMTKLRPFCDYSSSPCLDVQRLAAQKMHLYKKELPGLQACAAHFLSRNYILSKQEQCSDWARRPLSEAQLEYAGLDAAVLLVLLAEIASGQLNEK